MSAPLRPSYESELEARVAELEAENVALILDRDNERNAEIRAQFRIAELEAALRPFAEADDPNRLSDADLDVVARILFEFRYYRRARDAIRGRSAP